MDVGTIIALVISGLVFVYSIFRDNTKDTEELKSRVATLETKSEVQETRIARLESEQVGLSKRMENLETKLSDVDKNVSTILALMKERESK